MKKRILAVVLAACTVLSMAGCGKLSNDTITIKKYKGLEIEALNVQEVTDEDVENSIASTLDSQATYKNIKKRAVKNGDVITLDYSGKVDGEKFDGGTAEDQELTIGSGQFIPGFEEAIIGHKLNETFDIDVTFPEDYGQETLNGKKAVFTITIDKIQEKILPELTMDLIKEMGSDAESIEAYKEQVRKDLEESNKQSAESAREQSIWTALIENCEVKEYPADLYNEIEENINSQFSYIASMYGQTVEDIVKSYYGISLDEMIKNLATQQMAVELIAKKEKLNVTDKEYEKEATKLAEEYGYETLEELESAAGENGKETIKDTLVQQRVADFLVKHSVEKQADSKTEK